MIEKGQVTVGRPRRAWSPATRSRRTRRSPGTRTARRCPGRARTLPVLYEDEHVIVVDKPAGLLTVPSAPDATTRTRPSARVAGLRAPPDGPRRPYVGAVHRLDRDTSGALAFALSPSARAALHRDSSAHHRIERRLPRARRGRAAGRGGPVDAPLRRECLQRPARGVARPGDEPASPRARAGGSCERLPRGRAARGRARDGTPAPDPRSPRPRGPADPRRPRLRPTRPRTAPRPPADAPRASARLRPSPDGRAGGGGEPAPRGFPGGPGRAAGTIERLAQASRLRRGRDGRPDRGLRNPSRARRVRGARSGA